MTNNADPDQLVSSEANWPGSILFALCPDSAEPGLKFVDAHTKAGISKITLPVFSYRWAKSFILHIANICCYCIFLTSWQRMKTLPSWSFTVRKCSFFGVLTIYGFTKHFQYHFMYKWKKRTIILITVYYKCEYNRRYIPVADGGFQHTLHSHSCGDLAKVTGTLTHVPAG